MSDQDFNFAPPPVKRDRPKPFAPPPWERDQYEQHERDKNDRPQPARETTAEHMDERVPEVVAAEVREEAAAAAPVAEAPVARAQDGVAGQARLDERAVAAMLTQLKLQEPDVSESTWKIALAMSFVLIVIGMAISIIGIVATTTTRAAVGRFGGAVLLVFGFGFIGIGFWVTYRTLRQRGVL